MTAGAVGTAFRTSDSGQHKQWTGYRAGDITALRIGCVASQRVRLDPAGSRDVGHHGRPKSDSRHRKAPQRNPRRETRVGQADRAPRKPLAGQGNLGICRQGDLLHRPSSCPITRRWGRGHQRTALSAVQASLIAFPSPVCPELGIIRKRNHTIGARRCERAKGNRSARPAKHVRCQRKPHPARRPGVVHCRTVGGDLCHTTSAPTAAPRLPATIPTIPSATAVSAAVRLPRIRNALTVAGVNTQ